MVKSFLNKLMSLAIKIKKFFVNLDFRDLDTIVFSSAILLVIIFIIVLSILKKRKEKKKNKRKEIEMENLDNALLNNRKNNS